MPIRAKFRCMSETRKKWGPEDSHFTPAEAS